MPVCDDGVDAAAQQALPARDPFGWVARAIAQNHLVSNARERDLGRVGDAVGGLDSTQDLKEPDRLAGRKVGGAARFLGCLLTGGLGLGLLRSGPGSDATTTVAATVIVVVTAPRGDKAKREHHARNRQKTTILHLLHPSSRSLIDQSVGQIERTGRLYALRGLRVKLHNEPQHGLNTGAIQLQARCPAPVAQPAEDAPNEASGGLLEIAIPLEISERRRLHEHRQRTVAGLDEKDRQSGQVSGRGRR